MILSGLFISSFSFSQINYNFHQVVELSDSVTTVNLDLPNEFELVTWAGNTIMIETKIELYDGTQSILDFFLEQGRYELLTSTIDNTNVLIEAKDKERRPIQTKKGVCYELIQLKIFVPESFGRADSTTLLRPTTVDN